MTKILGAIFVLTLVGGAAYAQLPTTVMPNGAGGYNSYTPGQMPEETLPNGAGGYNVYGGGPVQPESQDESSVYQAPREASPEYEPYTPLGAGTYDGESAGEQTEE